MQFVTSDTVRNYSLENVNQSVSKEQASQALALDDVTTITKKIFGNEREFPQEIVHSIENLVHWLNNDNSRQENNIAHLVCTFIGNIKGVSQLLVSQLTETDKILESIQNCLNRLFTLHSMALDSSRSAVDIANLGREFYCIHIEVNRVLSAYHNAAANLNEKIKEKFENQFNKTRIENQTGLFLKLTADDKARSGITNSIINFLFI